MERPEQRAAHYARWAGCRRLQAARCTPGAQLVETQAPGEGRGAGSCWGARRCYAAAADRKRFGAIIPADPTEMQQLRQFAVADALRAEDVKSLTAGLLPGLHVLNAAVEYAQQAVHSAFGHNAQLVERSAHPRGLALGWVADVELTLVLRATPGGGTLWQGRHTKSSPWVRKILAVLEQPWTGGAPESRCCTTAWSC